MDELRIDLTVKQFNEMVKYLKRVDDIGDDFFLRNDIIMPSVRGPKNRPGQHIIRNKLPIPEDYAGVCYGIARLSETTKELGEIKGKKTDIYMTYSMAGVWIFVSGINYQLAGVFDDDQAALMPDTLFFDDYLKNHDWYELSVEQLTDLKHGNALTLEDDRNTTYVRIAKDLFKLRGVSRLSAPVDHTGEYYIQSPTANVDTIVIGSDKEHGRIDIHMIYPIIECIHSYLFDPFH